MTPLVIAVAVAAALVVVGAIARGTLSSPISSFGPLGLASVQGQ